MAKTNQNPAESLFHAYNSRLSNEEQLVVMAPNCAAALMSHASDSLRRAQDNVKRVMDDASPSTSNTIPELNGTLWSIVTDNDWLDASWRALASVAKACRQVDPRAYFPMFPGRYSTINVPVVMSAGEALVDQLTVDTTDIQSRTVPLLLHDVNRRGELSYFTIRNGAELRRYLGAFNNSVNKGVFEQFVAAVKGKLPAAAGAASDTTSAGSTTASTGNYGLVELALASFVPKYVAQSVAPLFGDKGDVDTLLLSSDAWSMLERYDAFGLPLEDGRYGVRHYEKSGLLSDLGVTGKPGYAVAMQRDAMIMASAVQDMGEIGKAYDIIPMSDPETGIQKQLVLWVDKSARALKFSLETAVGFAPGLLDRLYVIRNAAS